MIIIAPFAKPMRNGAKHPKNYPYWEELITQIKEPIIQVGTLNEKRLVADFRANLSLPQLAKLVSDCRTWIAVDSFFQHFCWDLGKPGIVIFGQSDPLIFGHPENNNLLKSRSYLREKQFWMWEQIDANDDVFVMPKEVLATLNIN